MSYRNIDFTPLTTKSYNFRSSLRPCLKFNWIPNLLKLSEHTHKQLTFICINCNRRQITRADSVIHKHRNIINGCQYCRTDSNNNNLQILNSLIYDYISNYHKDNEHQYCKIEKRVSNYRVDIFIESSEFFKRPILIELDDDSHINNLNTRYSDMKKHQFAERNDISIIRIKLNKNQIFTQSLKDEIIQTIENIRISHNRSVTIINDTTNGKLTRLINSYI
jgi:hypothetical protein